ncbi:MAG TPA: hypothetical protein DCW90_18990 [Lachnospiraceae bacterium]|nr:hypothetical protein [Lachnospiraceae bacterium]
MAVKPKKPKFLTCVRCKREFHSCNVRYCERFNRNMCGYCCMKCRFVSKEEIGWGCEFKNNKE